MTTESLNLQLEKWKQALLAFGEIGVTLASQPLVLEMPKLFIQCNTQLFKQLDITAQL